MKRKAMAVLLALTLLGSQTAVFAEAEEGAAQEVDYYGFEEPVTIKIGISRAADFEYDEGETALENHWMDLYREHNIVPELLYEVDSSQAATKLSTAIMSGDYPDILRGNPSEYMNYARTGVVADITDVFEEYATDELREYLNTDGGLAMQSVMVDGRLYGLPLMGSPYDSVMLMFIRQDWLDNLGLSVPQTMDEFKEVAHAFTYDDPDQNGQNDTYGLALDGMNVLTNNVGDASAIFNAFGASLGTDGMAFVEAEDGTVTWGGTNVEGMKAALQLLQDMYADGSLPTDFITMDSNSIFEETGGGRCGIWFAPMWGAMVPNSNAIISDPDAHMVCAPAPDGLDQGGTRPFLVSSVSSIFSVSSKCEHPEVLIKLMNLSVQKLCYPESEEEYNKYYDGWKLSLTDTLLPLKNYDNYQKESKALETGDTSELNTEQSGDYTNMKAFLDAYNSGDYDPEDPAFQAGVGLYTVFGDPNGSYAALDKLITSDQFTLSAYNSIPTDAMAENAATLKKLLVETIVKIITGEPVDSYDDMLSTWYALGGETVIADAQAWADSNK